MVLRKRLYETKYPRTQDKRKQYRVSLSPLIAMILCPLSELELHSSLNSVTNLHFSFLHCSLVLLSLRATASLKQDDEGKDCSSTEEDPVESCKDGFCFHGVAGWPVAWVRSEDRLGHDDETDEEKHGIKKLDNEVHFRRRRVYSN